MSTTWKTCSSCKTAIGFNQRYWVCSVSTCNRVRNTYVFCSVRCWDAHVPVMRHRDAWAEERRAPAADESSAAEGRRRVVRPAGTEQKSDTPREILIVASRLKDYIKARSDMNTSANVLDVLSDHVRFLCNDAIDNARADGRKTVKARDFKQT